MKRRVPIDLIGFFVLAAVSALVYWSRPQRAPRVTPAASESIEVESEPMRLEVGEGDLAGSALNREGVELANAGRFGEAVAKLRQAQQAAPTNPVVKRNLQAVLVAWGTQELEAGHARIAADRFIEALALDRTPQVLTGLGIAYVRGHEWNEAIAVLQESVERGAKDPPTYVALAEAYEATNDRVRALEMLQRARDAGLSAPGLEARIERLGREVDAEWDFKEEESRHFVVRFDAGEDAYAATQVLRSLESAYEVVGRKFGYFPDRPTSVVLYAEQDFHHITQTPDWAGALFDGRLKFPVRGLAAGDELDRVARHEYAHALITLLANGRVPAWLNEGLAMWAEDDSFGERRTWAEQTLGDRALAPLAALNNPFATLPSEYVQAAYAQSYLTVLYLLEQYDERRVPKLLDAMRHGAPLEGAFAEVYPVGLARFEEEAAKQG